MMCAFVVYFKHIVIQNKELSIKFCSNESYINTNCVSITQCFIGTQKFSFIAYGSICARIADLHDCERDQVCSLESYIHVYVDTCTYFLLLQEKF